MPKSIRTRMFRYLLLSMALIILCFAVLFFSYQNRLLGEEYTATLLFSVEKTKESVNGLLTSIRQNAYYLCCNSALANALMNMDKSSGVKQINIIRQILSINTNIPSSAYLSNTGTVLLLDGQFPSVMGMAQLNSLNVPINTRVFRSEGVAQTAWYQKTKEFGTAIYAFLDEEQPDKIFFSHRLNNIYLADERYTDEVGTMLYIMPKSSLRKNLAGNQISSDTISLLAFDDMLLCTTDEEHFSIGSTVDESMLPLSKLQAGQRTAAVQMHGKSYIMAKKRIDEHWQVLMLFPVFDLWSSMQTLMPMFLLGAVILILIAVIVSSTFARRLSAPIVKLSGAMRKARSKCELPDTIPVPKADREIEYLYQSYNEIVENIRYVTEIKRQKHAELQRAELKALQSQINPHFLYNTLDSVNCIALMNGEEDIATMVTSLISILKYSVHFTKIYVSLAEEINYLNQYIAIQKLRFEDNFSFAVDIPQDFLKVRVVKLMIQPLVENALFHAENSEQTLEIRVWCEEKNENILIHVCDNGLTADADRLNAMLDEKIDVERFGIGIRNVNRRIRLMAGEAYGIRYTKHEDSGLEAVITLPKIFE